MNKRQQEARARYAAALAAQKELSDKLAAQEVTRAAARAKLTALEKRESRVPFVVIASASSAPALVTNGFLAFRPAYGAARDERALKKQLGAGEVKLTMPGGAQGVTVALSTAAQRTRVPTREARQAIKVALRKLERTQRANQAAAKVYREAVQVAFETGGRLAKEDFIAPVAKGSALWFAANEHEGYGWDPMHSVNDDVEQARMHLEAAKSGAECACWDDVRARQQAQREQDERDRRAALPTAMATCPGHGRRRVHWERRDYVRGPDGYTYLPPGTPIGYCPIDAKAFVLTKIIAADEKAATKAAAKAAREAKKRKPIEAGSCDECGTLYDVSSREDHCAEEGLCWEHCTDEAHYEQSTEVA